MDNNKKCFLAANSCEGFISYFDCCYDYNLDYRAYIIKGGPGTGKSSFMKKVASAAEEKGMKLTVFPCSSDPNSLDGIILPEVKVVILDGTSPHVVEPKFIGACEEILNFSAFLDTELLTANREQIRTLTEKNRKLHKNASNRLKAAGIILKDNYDAMVSLTDKKKALLYAQALCSKNIKKSNTQPYEWSCFLGGITPLGIADYSEAISDAPLKTIAVEDELGGVSNIIMTAVRDYALKNGHKIITVKNPFLPSLITDHIIIPELSLCFARCYTHQRLHPNIRKIHSSRFIDLAEFGKLKKKLKADQKIINSLLGQASVLIAEAKSVHDHLESFYINAMDFELLNEFQENFIKKIIN